jgi:hypothetical protein
MNSAFILGFCFPNEIMLDFLMQTSQLHFNLYVERVEYTPSAVHFHVMESRTLGCGRTLWILIHRPTNSWSSTTDVILVRSDMIQLTLLSSQ